MIIITWTRTPNCFNLITLKTSSFQETSNLSFSIHWMKRMKSKLRVYSSRSAKAEITLMLTLMQSLRTWIARKRMTLMICSVSRNQKKEVVAVRLYKSSCNRRFSQVMIIYLSIIRKVRHSILEEYVQHCLRPQSRLWTMIWKGSPPRKR